MHDEGESPYVPADATSPQGWGLTPPGTRESSIYIKIREPLRLKVRNVPLPVLVEVFLQTLANLPIRRLRRRNCDYGGDITGVGAVPHPRGWQHPTSTFICKFSSCFAHLARARAHILSLLTLLLSHQLVSIYLPRFDLRERSRERSGERSDKRFFFLGIAAKAPQGGSQVDFDYANHMTPEICYLLLLFLEQIIDV